MHWGVAIVTACADVNAMMMGSRTDDHIRHNPDYIDDVSVQSALKKAQISYNVQSPALLLRGQLSTSYLAREPCAIPTPATTASPAPYLIIPQSCCCVRVRCVFRCIFVSRRGAKRSDILFQEMPRPHRKRPRASVYS